MGYGDLDDLENVFTYKMPKDYPFLLAQDVDTRLNLGENVFDLSVEKWTHIRRNLEWVRSRPLPDKYMHNFGMHIGYRTCALCSKSIREYENTFGKMKVKEDKCLVCPLAKVNCCIDKGSVYHLIEKLIKFTQNDDPELDKWLEELDENVKRMISNIEKSRTLNYV